MSELRHSHQHRHGPLGQCSRRNSQGDRESAPRSHHQVLPLTIQESDDRGCCVCISEGEILNDRPKSAGAVADLRALTQVLAGYREPNHGRSVVEILIIVVPFILLRLLMWWTLRIGYGIYLLLAIPTAGFLVRLFMIQHDCGHGSSFRHRLVNE